MKNSRTRQQNILLILLPAMFLLFLCLQIWVSLTQRGVMIEDAFFPRQTEGGTAVYRGSLDMQEGVIRVSPGNEEYHWDISVGFGDAYQTEYEVALMPGGPELGQELIISQQGETLFQGRYSALEDMLLDESGQMDFSDFQAEIGFPDDARDWSEFRVGRYTLAVLASGEPNHHRGSWPVFLLTASATALVLLSVAFPQALFRLRYALSVYNAEPSDFYLFAQKAGWYIFPVLLLIGYIVSLVLVT